MKKFSVFFIFTLLLLSQAAVGQIVVEGKADLSRFNIEKDFPVHLSGKWEFYWNRLLSPEDFKIEQNPEWIDLPGSWQWNGKYPALGFATYRVRLVLPKKQNDLLLYFPAINSSARVWVNAELVTETGKVNTNPKQYEAKLAATVVSIPENIQDIEIIVQVANFSYYSGGIAAGSPQLDKSSSLFARMNSVNGISIFFAGSLIAMCIYQLILYFLYQRGKPYLWLALICLGVALRSIIVHGGSFLLPNLYPSVSLEVWKKIEFGSVYAIVALFPLYIYHLFPNQAPKKALNIFVSLAVALCFMVIINPQYIYGKLLDLCHLALLLAFIYAVYSVSRAWKAGSMDARIILIGVLVSFPFILLEILKNTSFFPIQIRFMYLVELGVLIFLLFQVYLLANHYAKSYKNLEGLNQNLEIMVEARTGELRTANKVKDRLLSLMSHDIKSPLNSLRGILQIYNKGLMNKDEFQHFTQLIENDLSKTSILVENILYWTASQIKGVQVKLEEFDLDLLIEENLNLFQTIAANKKITLHYETQSNLIIKTDRNILNLVLRNLISNALKFSFEGGSIQVHVSLKSESLIIQIKDHGIGMNESTLKSLLESETTISTMGTGNEKGTGLGLALCREYLEKTGGELMVESSIGKGSTFNILLPLGNTS